MLQDIRTGNLPQVSWIVPPYEACEHPDMLPAAGEITSARSSRRFGRIRRFGRAPHSSSSTTRTMASSITSFRRRLRPGRRASSSTALPIGLGFRVPCLVISPFSRGGFVCSDTFDHTSTLAPHRDALRCRGSLSHAMAARNVRRSHGGIRLRSTADTSIPVLPQTAEALHVVEQSVGTLPAPIVPYTQAMPKQETAFIRRRRPSRTHI